MLALFPSYTTLKYLLEHDMLNAGSLDKSLFFFGCAREWVTEEATRRPTPYTLLIEEHIVRAEKEGRVGFCKPDIISTDHALRQSVPWTRLAVLLAANRIELPPTYDEYTRFARCSPSTIREALYTVCSVWR